NETLEIRNRIAWSENFNDTNWPKTNGVTATPSQNDPWGSQRASLLARPGDNVIWSGAYPSQALAQGMQRGIDDTGSPIQGYLSFWAKAGTLECLSVSVFDGTRGYIELHRTIALSTSWRRYVVPFCRNEGGGARTLVICPGANQGIKGDCYLVGVQ